VKSFYFFRHEDDRHDDFVRGLAWHPRNESLYSCGWDKQVLAHKLALSPNKMEVNGIIEKDGDQEQKLTLQRREAFKSPLNSNAGGYLTN
jgi:hypothetical protein